MKRSISKTLFVCTLLILGVGVGIFFICEKSVSHKPNPMFIPTAQEFSIKYNSLKQQQKIDLTADEDLTIAVMNLLGIEEHLFFTGAKTNKSKYYDLIDEVREIRKSLLKKLIPKYEGEVWCISKHLLAASYRLMETGTKQLHSGNRKEAYKLFEQGYRLYLLFWKINKSISLAADNAPIATQDNVAKSCVFNPDKINCCAE